MKILSNELKPLFEKALTKAFGKECLDVLTVDSPSDTMHGDYSCAAPLRLAKKLKISPQEVAEEIIKNLPKDYRIESTVFANPGFINLKLSKEFLEESLKALEGGFSVEVGQETKQPVIVEYSSTNAAKPMGVHHLITTILGQSLSDLFEFMGYDVIRINHLGDWGTHFGKLIYAVETWGDQSEIHNNPNAEFLRLYVKFNTEAEKNPALDDEARKINKALEEGDELRKAMWEWMVKESLEDLAKIFKRLGVHFDHIIGESFYLSMTDEVLADGKRKTVFIEGEGGSLIYPFLDKTPALVQKSDGTTLYLTRDVATVKYRMETWHPQSILYVVDHAQSLHFQQDFAIARALGYAEDCELEHISFGRMSFADKSMSTRKGNVILVEQILEEAVQRAGKIAVERAVDLPREELQKMMETVGIGSIKYAILSQDRVKDIIFEWDKMISLEGNSAPYLLYAYARANSIIKKSGENGFGGLPKLKDEREVDMVRKMCKFPEILQSAVKERKPHIVSTYLYELCQEFNRFYGALPVNNAQNEDEKRCRLGIVQAFMHQMKAGLGILGIPVLDKM